MYILQSWLRISIVSLFLSFAIPAWANDSGSQPITANTEENQPTPQTEPIEESPSTEIAGKHTIHVEWFGMATGIMLHFRTYYENDRCCKEETRVRPMMRLDLRLFTLEVPYFAVTLLELHPTAFIGPVGGGMRFSARIPLTADKLHELRLGSYVGMDYIFYFPNYDWYYAHLTVEPQLEYRYNTKWGALGAGLAVPILRHFDSERQSHEIEEYILPKTSAGLMLYFTFSVGRLGF